MRSVGLTALPLVLVVATGCAHYPHNARLTDAHYRSDGGYRFPAMVRDRPDSRDELFVCLSFSGGGTRAAAFAYGALRRLRDLDIGRGGVRKSLLDEVDCIAGISGGAFTAAYYGLFGSATFDRFHDRFLARNLQRELALAAINPWNLARLASPYFSRIDLAAELYDTTVFGGATFAALGARRPFVILHATNMANGAPFEFMQDDFDFFGSDLAQFSVGRAVAASSAFPFLLSPVSLQSYPPPSGFQIPPDVMLGLQSRELNPSRYAWARHHVDLMTKEGVAKWIHLLDGGLADNLGLRSILRSYDRASGFIGPRVNAGHIKRLVVIAVNARTDPPEHLGRRERSPGIADVFMKTATVSMEHVSVDTLEYAIGRQREREQAQTNMRQCNQRLAGCGAQPFPTFAQEIRTCFVEISFEGLSSPGPREEFLGLPTTFALPEATVTRLVDVAGTLLDGSEDFQRLVRALRGEASMGAGIGERGNCS